MIALFRVKQVLLNIALSNSLFWIMRFIPVSIALVIFHLLSASLVVAAPVQNLVGQPNNVCALYASLQNGQQNKAIHVQVLRADYGVVQVLILGLPRYLNANINGIDVSRKLAQKEQVTCGQKAIGEVRTYDLRSMQGMDSGYFEIKADQLSAGQSINLR